MKKAISILLILMSCKGNKATSLPEINTCRFPINVFDIQPPQETNHIKTINNLSYKTTYTMISGKYDSIQKNSIRYKIDSFAKNVIQKELKNINIENDNAILKASYAEIFNLTHSLKRIDHTTSILSEAYLNENNLLIIINTYPKKTYTTTYVDFYIFNDNATLLYLDRLKYNCDIRNLDALEKVLQVGCKKITQNSE